MEEVADVGVVGEWNAPGNVLVRDMSERRRASCYFTPAVELESGYSSRDSRRRQRRQNKQRDSGLGRPWSGMKIGFELGLDSENISRIIGKSKEDC